MEVSPATLPAALNPSVQDVSLYPGQEGTVFVELLNLGTDVPLEGTLLFTVTNTLGSVTDTAELTFTLLRKAGETVLTVYTLDASTGAEVSGIPVTASWTGGGVSGITSGGAVSWSLGSIQPHAEITTLETPTYHAASTSIQCTEGQNTVTLKLTPKGDGTFPWWMLLLIPAGVAVYVMYRRRRS